MSRPIINDDDLIDNAVEEPDLDDLEGEALIEALRKEMRESGEKIPSTSEIVADMRKNIGWLVMPGGIFGPTTEQCNGQMQVLCEAFQVNITDPAIAEIAMRLMCAQSNWFLGAKAQGIALEDSAKMWARFITDIVAPRPTTD